jgi:hypothetical protein
VLVHKLLNLFLLQSNLLDLKSIISSQPESLLIDLFLSEFSLAIKWNSELCLSLLFDTIEDELLSLLL